MAVTFDLFGTLVSAERPEEPWEAVASELADRGVSVPGDWEAAYREGHVDVEPLAELSLVEHTAAALASRGRDPDRKVVRAALLAAFDGPVTVRNGAADALTAAADRGPVGICSNCSLPGLVDRVLDRASLPAVTDAVVTSVDCGWRKPHDRAFEAVADRLGVDLVDLVHVGDDPRCDGGARTTDASVLLLEDVPLTDVPDRLEAFS